MLKISSNPLYASKKDETRQDALRISSDPLNASSTPKTSNALETLSALERLKGMLNNAARSGKAVASGISNIADNVVGSLPKIGLTETTPDYYQKKIDEANYKKREQNRVISQLGRNGMMGLPSDYDDHDYDADIELYKKRLKETQERYNIINYRPKAEDFLNADGALRADDYAGRSTSEILSDLARLNQKKTDAANENPNALFSEGDYDITGQSALSAAERAKEDELNRELYISRQHDADVSEYEKFQRYQKAMSVTSNPDYSVPDDLRADLEAGTRNDKYDLYGIENGVAQYMTDDEIGAYDYVFRTQGEDAAARFLEDIVPYARAENRRMVEEKATQFASAHPTGASAIDVLRGFLKPVEYVAQAADFLSDGKLTENAIYNKATWKSNATQQKVSEIVEDNYGKVGSAAYSIGMSMANFVTQNVVGGAIGGAGTKAAKALSLAIMGSGAAADGVVRAMDRGLTDTQAFALGTIEGLAEIITEKLSIDTLLDPKLWRESTIKYVLKNTLVEGSEEVGSDLINLAADALISRDQSEWNTELQQMLIENPGMTRNKAWSKLLGDQMQQIGFDFLAGAISGGIMSGAQSAKFNFSQETDIANARGFRDTMLALEDVARGKEVSNRDVRTIARNEAGTEAINELLGTDLGTVREERQTAVREALQGVSDRANVAALESSIDTGERLKNSQIARIAKNSAAIEVLNRNYGTDIQPGQADTERQVRDTIRGAETVHDKYRADVEQYAKENFGKAGQTVMTRSYNGTQTSDQFIADMTRAYNMGRDGIAYESVSDIMNEKPTITEAQAQAAYIAGQADAERMSYGEAVQAVPVYEGAERNDGAYPAGQVETVPGGTNERVSTESRDREAAGVITSEYEVDLEAEGIPEGHSGKIYKVVGNYSQPMLDSIAYAAKHGVKLNLFVGDYLSYDNDADDVHIENSIRGVKLADGSVWVKADDSEQMSLAITKHEVTHVRVARGEIDMKAVKQRTHDILRAVGRPNDYEWLAETYARVFNGSGYTADDILEEIICDAEADINVFESSLTVNSERVHETLEVVRQAKKAGANQIRGPTEELSKAGIDVDTKDGSAYANDLIGAAYSQKTLNASEWALNQKTMVDGLAETLGVSKAKAKRYVNDIFSVAKLISNNAAKLDYDAAPGLSPFVSNTEYGGSIDFDTLCTKRRLFTGTFSAIQNRLSNEALTAEDYLKIRQMMVDAGLETFCGKCYVEGSRAAMGKFCAEFRRLYKQYYPNEWQPMQKDLTTPDGVEAMRLSHPKCYEQYERFFNNHGTLTKNDKSIFASQQKPKLYQAHSAYTDEILREFKGKEDSIISKNRNGGVRFQSFSDCEVIHIIDGMQAIMDMSYLGLNGQAYTKQENFALAFGNTGLKINLSIDAWGVDADGNLIFNDVEGMPFKTAMDLRDKFSENVGTICVVYDDAMLKAALADDRIDFIIPFHRSQWKKSQYGAMGLPNTTKDYTYQQNEKWLNPKSHTHQYRDRIVPTRCTNYMPNDYWDFGKSGKENAEAYLEMCARDGKRPKFYRFLVNNGDGSFSLQPDGSTDGYWKLLIDFKMYDNNGKGSPQMPVRPAFGTKEDGIKTIETIFNEYKGSGHESYPVAHGIVDQFVDEYNKKNGTKYSLNAFSDGRRFVDVKTDQKQFDGLSVKEASTLARSIIKKKFAGKVVGIDNRIFVNGRSAAEYSFSVKKAKDEDKLAKMRASTELDNLIDAGFNFRNEEDGQDGHIHADVIGGINKFDTIFKVGTEYFQGTINAKVIAKGELLIDVTQIKNITQDISNSYGENPKFTFLRDVSMPTVADTDNSVKQNEDIIDIESAGIDPDSDLNATVDYAANDTKGSSPQKFADKFPGAKYSQTLDSSGNQLTEAQAEYFKDSKVRDENGNLLVMYHGTTEDFNIFDYKKGGKNGTAEGRGFYFTDNPDVADMYGTKKEVYLDVKKPLYGNKKTVTRAELKKFVGAYLDNQLEMYADEELTWQESFLSDYLYTYGTTRTGAINEFVNIIFNGNSNDVDMIYDVANGSGANTVDGMKNLYTVLTEATGRDGIFTEWNNDGKRSRIVLTFESNQAKNITNETPTKNPDIRYSQRVTSLADLEKANTELRDQYNELKADAKHARERWAYWKGQTKLSNGASAVDADIHKTAKKLLKDFSSTMELDDAKKDLREIAKMFLENKDIDTVKKAATKLAEKVVLGAQELISQDQEAYEYIKTSLRKGVKLSAADKAEIPDYNDWRKEHFGTVNVSSNGVPVEDLYAEIQDQYGYLLGDAINTADMLDEIISAYESVSPVYENPFDMDRAEAVEYCADGIVSSLMDGEIRQTKPTFADKKQAELNAYKEKAQKKITELKQKRERDIAALKERHMEYVKGEREKKLRRELRGKIERHVKSLADTLTKPTDKRHIMDAFQAPVAELLSAINTESAFDNEVNQFGQVVGRAKKGEGFATKRTEAFRKLQDVLKNYKQDLVIDPDLFGTEEASGLFSYVTTELNGVPLYEMNSEQLTSVWKTVSAMEAAITSANKMFAKSRWANIDQAAEGFLSDNAGKKSKTLYEGYLGLLQNAAGLYSYTPQTYLHMLGKSGDSLFRLMRGAQDKQINLIKEASEKVGEMLKGVNVRELETELHAVDIGTEKRKMSTAQIMELYCLMQRPQARAHLENGGVYIEERKTKGVKRLVETSAVVGTWEQYETITDLLSKQQKEACDKMVRFLSDDIAAWGNAASLAVYGYSKFGEKYYWPIRVFNNALHHEQGKQVNEAKTVSHKGMTFLPTPGASNSINIGSAFDTFTDHIVTMSVYNAWLGASEDINRLRNYKYDNGKNMADIIDLVHGRSGVRYLDKLMEDIAVGRTDSNEFLNISFGKFKGAAVGANLRVIIQQPTAILRSMDMLRASDVLAGGSTAWALNGWKKAVKYAPIAQWKDWGYFDIRTGRQLKDIILDSDTKIDKFNNFMMKGAALADSIGWGWLWNACELDVKRNNQALWENRSKDEAFYKKVAERFAEVVDKTQVVDGVLQRSQIMRDGDSLSKMMTSFMGEPTKQFNMFAQSAYDAKQKLPGAGKKLARTSMAFLASGLLNVLAQSIVDGWRDDDKDKPYLQRVFEQATGVDGGKLTAKSALTSNIGSMLNPMNYVIVLKDIMSIIEGYDTERTDMSLIADLWTSGTKLWKATVDGSGKNSVLSATTNFAATFAKFYGIPIANINRDAWAIANEMAQASGNYEIRYEMLKLARKQEGNKGLFLDLLYTAYKNDPEMYERIRADLIKEDRLKTSNSTTEDYINDAIRDREWEDVGIDEFNDLSEDLMRTERYSKMSGNAQDKAVEVLKEIVKGTSTEKQETVADLMGDVEGAAFFGDLEDAKAWNPEKSSANLDQSEISHVVEDYYGDYDDRTKAILWSIAGGGKSKNNPWYDALPKEYR